MLGPLIKFHFIETFSSHEEQASSDTKMSSPSKHTETSSLGSQRGRYLKFMGQNQMKGCCFNVKTSRIQAKLSNNVLFTSFLEVLL